MVEKEKDIVERLRNVALAVCHEAAQTIENCRDEIERLRRLNNIDRFRAEISHPASLHA